MPRVRANEARLGQVFLNLLVNAAQAIPEGDATRHCVTLVTRREGARVVVEVRDTGAGIVPGRVSLVPLRDLLTMGPLGIGGNLLVLASLGFFGGLTVPSVALVSALARAASTSAFRSTPKLSRLQSTIRS